MSFRGIEVGGKEGRREGGKEEVVGIKPSGYTKGW